VRCDFVHRRNMGGAGRILKGVVWATIRACQDFQNRYLWVSLVLRDNPVISIFRSGRRLPGPTLSFAYGEALLPRRF
jgi:hypothetical protein